MDKFLTGYKRKSSNNEESDVGTSSKNQEGRTPKTRKYDSSYLSFGFTSVITDNVEKPMCLFCSKVLAPDSMRPGKLKRHIETMHSQYVGKSQEFFQRKLDEFTTQKQTFKNIVHIPSNALLASYLVSYRIAKCKKPHTIGETLVLPAAIDMVKTMFGESYAKQLRQIPLADNTVGRRIDDISDDLCDQLVSQMRTSKFALQVDEATDVAKDAHLIAYVRYVEENNIIEDILFCKPIPGKATSSEIFNIIDNFFDENGILWNNCIGLCTDGAQSMSGHKTGLQALIKRKTTDVLWTHCMLHRAALVSKNMMSCCLFWIFILAVLITNYKADVDLDSHPVVYTRGNYSVDNILIVNQDKEYILSFPNTSTSNPYRLSAYSEEVSYRYPALIVVRQRRQVLSWQLPLRVDSSVGRLHFRNTSRTLCHTSRQIRQSITSEESAISKTNFSVSVSTSSPESISVTIRADEVNEFFIEDDRLYTATISPSEPIFYYYNFPEGEGYSRAFVEVDSEDEVCLLVSIQDAICPVRDLNTDIRFEGNFQTINLKGALTVSERLFPQGFFLVFVAMGDNYECSQESSILPIPTSRRSTINVMNRTSEIHFKIRQGISSDKYLMAILVVFLANVAFCLLFISTVAIFHYCRKKKNEEEEDENDEDEVDQAYTNEVDIVDHYLNRNELTVQDFCTKHSRLQRKSYNYFWHITNIAIFYGIPVVQLMVAYQRMVNMTGDLDTCYHNFMCAHPLADVSDFNHIYSNIGYMILGILFLFVTLFSQKMHRPIPKCGIPRHYGLFYAMGVALIVEGILSACYHICPNQSNYQFDTSFMYVMAVLCMIKLYQNRHPRINASAYSTFTILGIAVFMAMLGILTSSMGVMIIFVIFYLFLCAFLSVKIYFFGYVLSGITYFVDNVKERNNLKEAVTPIRKGTFVLLSIANICNIGLAVIGIIFYPSSTDFGTYLLLILMGNALLHAVFYISMKLLNKERICWEANLYGLLAVICWAGAGYFFLNGSTLWTVTPAESRQFNQECLFMSFYDQHDIWHLLSAPGLFFTFMLLMHLDDDIEEVPRNMIKAF